MFCSRRRFARKFLKPKGFFFFNVVTKKVSWNVSGSDVFTVEIRAPSREAREALFFLGHCTLFIKVPYSSILLKSKGLVKRGAIQLQDECQKLVLYEYWLLLDIVHNVPRDGNGRRLWISYYIEKESNKKSNNGNTLLSHRFSEEGAIGDSSSHEPPTFWFLRCGTTPILVWWKWSSKEVFHEHGVPDRRTGKSYSGGEDCTVDQASVLEVEWCLIVPGADDENLKTYEHAPSLSLLLN